MKVAIFIFIVLNTLYLLRELATEKSLDLVYLGNIIVFISLLIKGV